ncbi:MAG: hypothetical protein OXI81_04680 [Paracoccaceae bacterium]|nr:hypothetical protein [Paracoccaceae bacterium]MDE2913149.1 hypothetical protein [Paracoccaceae bacterium]
MNVAISWTSTLAGLKLHEHVADIDIAWRIPAGLGPLVLDRYDATTMLGKGRDRDLAMPDRAFNQLGDRQAGLAGEHAGGGSHAMVVEASGCS